MNCRAARVRWAAMLCLFSCGCSLAREIPRDQYATRSERERVKVETRAGQRYEFDRIHVVADSLYGDRHLDVEGSFDQIETVGLPLSDVAKLSVRQVDWYRTGLIAGVGAAAVLAAVLSQVHSGSNGGSDTGPCGGRPCP